MKKKRRKSGWRSRLTAARTAMATEIGKLPEEVTRRLKRLDVEKVGEVLATLQRQNFERGQEALQALLTTPHTNTKPQAQSSPTGQNFPLGKSPSQNFKGKCKNNRAAKTRYRPRC